MTDHHPAKKIVRRASSEPKRRLIIHSATVVFGDRGYEGASLRDIAAHAGLSLSAVVHHFNGKKDLYDQALAQALHYVMSGFLQIASSDGDINDRFRRMISEGVGVVMQDVSELKLVDRAMLQGEAIRELTEGDFGQNYSRILREFFTELTTYNQSQFQWDEFAEIYVGFIWGILKTRRFSAQSIGPQFDVSRTAITSRAIRLLTGALTANQSKP